MARIIKKESQKKEAPEMPAVSKKRNNFSFKAKLKLALIVIVVFFILNAVAVVAKTGLVQIPVFSQLFYRLPLPTRIVELPDPFVPDPANMKVTGSTQEGVMNFAFGEKEITYILRRTLVEKNQTFAENLQLVVTPDYLELYGLQLKPYKANLTVRLKPAVNDGKLEIDIISYKIGNLNLPPFVAELMLNKLVKKGQTSKALTDLVQILNFNLGDGKLNLTAKINMKNLLQVLSVMTAGEAKKINPATP